MSTNHSNLRRWTTWVRRSHHASKVLNNDAVSKAEASNNVGTIKVLAWLVVWWLMLREHEVLWLTATKEACTDTVIENAGLMYSKHWVPIRIVRDICCSFKTERVKRCIWVDRSPTFQRQSTITFHPSLDESHPKLPSTCYSTFSGKRASQVSVFDDIVPTTTPKPQNDI